jgi:hypothetical protein
MSPSPSHSTRAMQVVFLPINSSTRWRSSLPTMAWIGLMLLLALPPARAEFMSLSVTMVGGSNLGCDDYCLFCTADCEYFPKISLNGGGWQQGSWDENNSPTWNFVAATICTATSVPVQWQVCVPLASPILTP